MRMTLAYLSVTLTKTKITKKRRSAETLTRRHVHVREVIMQSKLSKMKHKILPTCYLEIFIHGKSNYMRFSNSLHVHEFGTFDIERVKHVIVHVPLDS